MLPAILKKAVLLLVACGMAAGAAAFCITVAGQSGNMNDKDGRMRIGYVASDDALMDMVAAYVQEIASVKELCSLERISGEDGFALLQEGELAALVVLPEDIVGEIITGRNAPVTVYMGSGSALDSGDFGKVRSLLFEELADSAVGMLETAQAEIYAVQYVLNDALWADKELRQSLYDTINSFNLRTVADRERLFREQSISATENDTYVIYYGSALLTLYLLFVGVFFGGFFCRSKLWQKILEKRLGISKGWQVLCGLIAGLFPVAVIVFLPFAALTVPYVRAQFHVAISPGMAGMMLLLTIFGTLYFMLIYQSLGKERNAVPAIGLLALIQGYLSGCLVPSALMPDLVYRLGRFLPAVYVKSAFTVLLSGDTGRLFSAVSGLLVWVVVLFAANVTAAYTNVRFGGKVSETGALKIKKLRTVPPAFWVILKRMLLKRSVLISFVFMTVVSVFIVRLEEQSDTTLTAAVFDESGEYEEQLLAHGGLVHFVLCGSEAEVKELVLKNEAECGYLLPGDLTKKITAMRANRSVTVYKGADSVCVPLVNEVLFEVLFRHASLAWYQAYLAEYGVDSSQLQNAFISQIELGKTFGIEFVMCGEDSEKEGAGGNKQTYPIVTVVAAAVILCGVQGLLTAVEDCRKGRYYKKGRGRLLALTIVLPMIAALLVGGMLLFFYFR